MTYELRKYFGGNYIRLFSGLRPSYTSAYARQRNYKSTTGFFTVRVSWYRFSSNRTGETEFTSSPSFHHALALYALLTSNNKMSRNEGTFFPFSLLIRLNKCV